MKTVAEIRNDLITMALSHLRMCGSAANSVVALEEDGGVTITEKGDISCTVRLGGDEDWWQRELLTYALGLEDREDQWIVSNLIHA